MIFNHKILFGSFFVALAFARTAHAFTLIDASEPKFGTNEVIIDVAGNTCTNAGLTPAELLTKIGEAVDRYWNKIPTCAIELKIGAVTSADVSGDSASQAIVKAEANHILVGCNSNTTDVFTTAASQSGTLAVGTITLSGDTRGLVLINDTAPTPFPGTDESQKLATLAHEVGHAIGIGHSEDPVALMFFSIGGKIQERLTIDDYDACSYLYPHDSVPGSCSSIAPIAPPGGSKDSDRKSFLGMFLIGAFLAGLFGVFFRRRHS